MNPQYLSNDPQDSEGISDKPDFAAQQEAWNRHADRLARWATERMLVRPDAYLGYYTTNTGAVDAAKRDGQVTPALLQRHFAALDMSNLIGLYTTSQANECRWLSIDLDRHGNHPDEVAVKNWKFAQQVFDRLTGLGFHSLLIDSNGRGGIHIFTFFDQTLPAQAVRSFGRWLVKDWQANQLASEPEVFPKQDSVEEGGYGNAVRLPGLHHTYQHCSQVWDGKDWASGEEAISIILAATGDPIDLIPDEAKDYQPPKPPTRTDEWWKQYDGDLRTLDVISLFHSRKLQVRAEGEREYEVTCPWADQHSTGGDTSRILLPNEDEGAFPTFNCFHAHCRGRSLRNVLEFFGKDAVDQHCRRRFGQDDSADRPIISPSDPLNAAREFHKLCFTHPDGGTLFHLEGRWMQWDGRTYQEVTDDDIRARLWHWLDTCCCRSKEGKLVKFLPNKSNVTGVVDALKAVANRPTGVDIPSWIEGGDLPKPENLVAFRNGLLDLEQIMSGEEPKLLPHTPRWFSANCLPHDFDPKADCPKWMAFLNQVCEGDEDRIRALAQWFGYCLTLDIRQQRFALLIGPPRSGKGTITTVLAAVLGRDNVAYPNLTALGTRFGLAPLVGKQAAVVPDGHLGRFADSTSILERLKSIVGGDPQNVDRKSQAELTGIPIKARFTICVNEMPRLPDASAALRSRLLLIPFHQTFEGREDFDLAPKLLDEIEGITNWALAGLRDLRQSGRLLQPTAGKVILNEFVRLSSPAMAFIDDCCQAAKDKSCPASLVYGAWRLWCSENGHEPGSNAAFGAKLFAALPSLNRARRRFDGKRVWCYEGLALTDEWEAKVNNPAFGLL